MAGAARRHILQPPIVVAGMHRSGTTMLVDLLTKLGAFFGTRLDPNSEDYFFLRLNEWVMRRAGGAWDRPLPTVEFLGHPWFFDDTLEFLARRVDSPWFSDFTGKSAWFLPASRQVTARPWGFKDPRNTFTFDLWARIFPEARLLYIRRNGVDAANSLFVREQRRWADGRYDRGYLRIRPLIGRIQDALKPWESFADYLFSTRCLTLEASYRLWEEYVAAGEALYDGYPGPKMAVQFEAFITEPVEHLERIARFCGLAPAPDQVRDVAAHVARARAFSFRKDEGLCRFYEQVKGSPLMQRLGYGNIA